MWEVVQDGSRGTFCSLHVMDSKQQMGQTVIEMYTRDGKGHTDVLRRFETRYIIDISNPIITMRSIKKQQWLGASDRGIRANGAEG
jgi:hypothetical protein